MLNIKNLRDNFKDIQISLKRRGYDLNEVSFKSLDDSKFQITEFEKNYYFEFISNDTLQIKYKDNMNLDNLINFSKQNDK